MTDQPQHDAKRKQTEAEKVHEANEAGGVDSAWAVYKRADGSQYLVCLLDQGDKPDDQRFRSEPESPDDVRQPATVTP